MTTIIITSIYLISCLIAWYYMKLAYSKGGVWSNLNAKRSDIFMIFIPIINSFYFILFLTDYPKEGEVKLNKFFNIKK